MYRKFLVVLLTASPVFAGNCPTDFDGDGTTGFTDLTNLLGAWGPCVACPQDLDGNDEVGFTDLTQLLGAWGPCPTDQFDYPVYENALAVEIGQQYLNAPDEIVLPQEIYDRVNRDLALMEAARPEITGAPHQGPWVAFNVLVRLVPDQPLDELEQLIDYYQGERIDDWIIPLRNYDFPLGANPLALIPILESLAAVEYAQEATYVAGGPLTQRWEPTPVGGGAILWTVVVGWDPGGFCNINSSPCQCFSTYEFLIEADGTLTLIDLTTEPSPFGGGFEGDCGVYPPLP